MDSVLGKITLTEFGARWIEEHRLSRRTRDLYVSLFRLHIQPTLESKSLDELRPEDIRAWRARLRVEGRSETTAAKSYRLLRAILNTAVDDERIARNPCRIKGADREDPPERSVASVREVFELADQVDTTYRAFVMTAALASLRWGELAALRRRDVDLESGVIVVRQSLVERGGSLEIAQPKNNRSRVVAIPAVLVEELKRHLSDVPDNPDAAVFVGERGGVPRRGNGWGTRPYVRR